VLLKFKHFSRLYYVAITIVGLSLLGSFGFVIIEDYTFTEAFYMTIITMSTVGFKEVHDLSDGGRIFTIVLIISSIGVFTYSISAITTYFVAGEFLKVVKRSRNQTLLDKLDNHVIICGKGRVGNKAIQDLRAHNERYVLIEKDSEKLPDDTVDKIGAALHGDATQDEILITAGIKQAKALITTLPNDADNLYVVLTARELNPKLIIISRASKTESVKKLRIAGADNVIMPDDLGGSHMASLVVNPDVLEFLDHISIQGSADVNLEEVCYQDLPQSLKNKSIASLLHDGRFDVNIIGYKKQDGEFIINPSEDTLLDTHSKFFVLGQKTEIQRLNEILSVQE